MIALLEQRANVEQSASVQGVVVSQSETPNGEATGEPGSSSREEHLFLKLTSREGVFDEGMLVAMRGLGVKNEARTRVAELCKGISGEEILALAPPDRGSFPVGAAVDVVVVPKFGMKHHSWCLSRFLREEVEGA
jgi:hypothetical protein